jgi:hypothetical protein
MTEEIQARIVIDKTGLNTHSRIFTLDEIGTTRSNPHF